MWGRSYLVADATLIIPGVLHGSKGALFYPPKEIAKNPAAWNMMPILDNHPDRSYGEISARQPKVLEKQGLGFVFGAIIKNKKLVSELWFDEERTRKLNYRVYDALVNNRKIELSTGLYTKNRLARNGSAYNGKTYTHVALRYKPDHLAILIDQKGACSIEDGCGVLNKSGVLNSKIPSFESRVFEIMSSGRTNSVTRTTIKNAFLSRLCSNCDGNKMCGECQAKAKKGAKRRKSKVANQGEEVSMKTRKQQEAWLTANVDCWKGDDGAKALKSLPDETVKRLVTTEQTLGTVMNAFDNPVQIGDRQIKLSYNADEDQVEAEELKGDSNGDDDDDSDDDDSDDDADDDDDADKPAKNRGKGKVKPKKGKVEEPVAKNRRMTMDEFRAVAPLEYVEIVDNALDVRTAAKRDLIDRLVVNLDESEQAVERKSLAREPLKSLQRMARLLPKQDPLLVGNDGGQSSYVGGALPALGGQSLTDNANDGYEPLGQPTFNYANKLGKAAVEDESADVSM